MTVDVIVVLSVSPTIKLFRLVAVANRLPSSCSVSPLSVFYLNERTDFRKRLEATPMIIANLARSVIGQHQRALA